MRKYNLTAPEGETLSFQLPEGWHQVPLLPYLAFLAQSERLEERLHPHAVVAFFSGIPRVILESQPELTRELIGYMPWSRALPETRPVPTIKHQGKTYTFTCNLEGQRLSQPRWQALMEVRQSHQGEVIGPLVLAILYSQNGYPVTEKSIAKTKEAFQTLSVAQGWGGLEYFLSHFKHTATRFHLAMQRRADMLSLLSELEKKAARRAKEEGGLLNRLYARLLKAYAKVVHRKLTEDL